LESELGHDIREDVARLAVTNNWGLLELKSISMTLEDVFLKLTRHEEGLVQPADVASDGVAVNEGKTESPS
jgi:ABC-2 type transport system ATP-binding protein